MGTKSIPVTRDVALHNDEDVETNAVEEPLFKMRRDLKSRHINMIAIAGMIVSSTKSPATLTVSNNFP